MAQIGQNKWIQTMAAAVFLIAAFFAGRQAAAVVEVVTAMDGWPAVIAEGRQGVSGSTQNARPQEGAGSMQDEIADEAAGHNRMEKFTVVVDAGHGGNDPGKVGTNGAQEKDINLAIARRLAILLEQADVKAVMTRTDDNGLYDVGADRKKVQDMKRRIALMEEARPDIVVSIHQNSYGDPGIKGAQVFYHASSAEGKRLAEILQDQLIKGLDPQNHRAPKANSSYYLLKKTACPVVIAECGFLSNPQEAERLADPLWQERVAWQLHLGIMRYLNAAVQSHANLRMGSEQ